MSHALVKTRIRHFESLSAMSKRTRFYFNNGYSFEERLLKKLAFPGAINPLKVDDLEVIELMNDRYRESKVLFQSSLLNWICSGEDLLLMGTKKNPIKVQVCVQFFKVGEIDTLKEQYTADVIVRSRWREPSLDGQLSEGGDITDIRKYWNPKLYIENSYGDHKEMFRYRIVFNDKGEAYMTEKRTVKGTFMENLELDDFPFDVQDLTVTVASEFPYTDVEVVEDLENHHMVNKQSFVDEQEWHLYSHTECIQRELTIDQFDPSVRRSAVSVKCRAARRPGYFIWNIFMITFLICTLSFATFSVGKELPQNRLQLSFTLVLTAVAFKSVVNQSLPRISYLTYMDKYLLASMFMMSAVCTWHGVVTTLLGNKSMADFIEYIVLGCLAAIYVVYNIGFCILIYVFPCKKRRIMAQKDVEHNKRDDHRKHEQNQNNARPKNSY